MCGNIRMKNFEGPAITSTLVTTTVEIPTTTMIDSLDNGSDDIPNDSKGIILYFILQYSSKASVSGVFWDQKNTALTENRVKRGLLLLYGPE